jgi:hypothetical protein
LVDLLPNWGWNALFATGMLAPLVGVLISLATRTAVSWKWTAVLAFYAFSLPLAALVVTGRTNNPAYVCSFIVMMPVGMVLGLVVLVPASRATEQRGFEVRAAPQDDERE